MAEGRYLKKKKLYRDSNLRCWKRTQEGVVAERKTHFGWAGVVFFF